MVTDIQVRKLKKYLSQGKTLEVAAARAGMDETTDQGLMWQQVLTKCGLGTSPI